MNLFIIIILSLMFLLAFFMLLKIQNLQKSIDENRSKEIEIKNNLEKKDKLLDLQDIKTISLIDNNTSKEIINFEKIDISKITDFKYREVKLKGSLVSSVAAPVILDSIIKVSNPNGFFTATSNTNMLIQYNQGGYSSMVKGAKGIAKHSGFVSSAKNVFTPMIVFQALSFIIGLYYLHGITKQLSKILNKIDDLQFFIESEDLAKINVIQEEITDLSNKNIVTQQDFNTISNFKNELKFIKEKYKINIQKVISEIRHINENKISKDNISRLEENKNKIKKYSNIFYGCQQLLFYIEQIELFSYIKNKDFQYAEETYNRIENYTIEKISFDKTLKKIKNLKEKIGITLLTNKDKEISKLNNKFKFLDEKFKEDYDILEIDINNTKKHLNEKWNESQEILCYIDENNNQRMFIKDTSNNCENIEQDSETIDMIL